MIVQELTKPKCLLSPVGWDPCQNESLSRSLPPERASFSISLSSFPLRSFSAALLLRSPDQSVAKRGLQTSRVPGESPPPLPPSEATTNSVWERKEESVAQAATARYVEQERNYYRRVTYSDVLPLVESSHILHHRA